MGVREFYPILNILRDNYPMHKIHCYIYVYTMIIFIPKRITKIFHYKIFFVLFSWFRFLLLRTQNAPKEK